MQKVRESWEKGENEEDNIKCFDKENKGGKKKEKENKGVQRAKINKMNKPIVNNDICWVW